MQANFLPRRVRRLPVLALAFTLAVGTLQAASDLIGLGFLGAYTGTTNSKAWAISDDGTTVVGHSTSANGLAEAFKWTPAGMVALGDLNPDPSVGYSSIAFDVSADGSVVVGHGYPQVAGSLRKTHAFSYSGGSMTDLGTLGNIFATTSAERSAGVSGDGLTVVGDTQLDFGAPRRAFIYKRDSLSVPGTMSDLGTMGEGTLSYAEKISGDGSTVVGYATHTSDNAKDRAFRLVSDGVMEDLGTLPNGDIGSWAFDVNYDGSVVVGQAASGDGTYGYLEAFRWDSVVGMVGLGDLGENDFINDQFASAAYGVSSDGQVIVGIARTSTGAYPDEAFVYFETTGEMVLLESLLDTGLMAAAGFTQLLEASSVSSDGTYAKIVGVGLDTDELEQAFMATVKIPLIPEPAAMGFLSAAGLLSLAIWRRRGRSRNAA